MKIFYGKKTVLFPFEPKVDMEHFIDLHQKDKNGYMCRYCLKNLPKPAAIEYIANMIINRKIFIWTVMTKGKDAKRGGFVYLSDITEFSGSINGIMDTEFVKSLDKQMRRGKFTFAEDAYITMIDACFKDFNFLRIECDLAIHNKLAISLCQKVGFVKEGLRRQSYKVDEKYYDIVMMSILKEEWEKNGKINSAIHASSTVQRAG